MEQIFEEYGISLILILCGMGYFAIMNYCMAFIETLW